MRKTQEPKRKRRLWMIIGGALLVVVLVVGGVLLTQGQSQAQTAVATGDIVEAFIGDLSASATASGQVTAREEAQLAFQTSGTVADIYVSVGDRVQAGDPLLALDSADLERAVNNAQQTVVIQENNLATLLESASAADVAAAEAAVVSARANLERLQNSPTAEDMAAAEADVRAANADVNAAAARLNDLQAAADPDALQAAQIELELAQTAATQAAEQHSTILVTEPNEFLGEDRLAELEASARASALQANARLEAAQEALADLQGGDANAIAGAQAGLAAATAQRDLAQAQLDLLLAGPTEAQLAQAEAQLAQAEAGLDQLLRGPTDVQVTQAEVALEQARIGLQQAEQNLARATLTAPFAGTVTAVTVHEGELVGGVVLALVDDNNLEVVLSVDEVDLADLEVGQPAVITLETWPDQEIDGEVAAIAPSATTGTGALVTYEVYLTLGETDLPVLVGMTANADLVTGRRMDVLLLPNAAINADRDEGTYSVNLVSRDTDGTVTTTAVSVTIGLRDSQYTQITGGIEAGDEVLVGNTLPVQEFGGGPPEGGGPFGGGGGQ